MGSESKNLETIEQEAKKMLAGKPSSAVALQHSLLQEGFDRVSVKKVLKKFNWFTQAKIVAKREFKNKDTTPDMLAAFLAGHGFTIDERREAIGSFDWIPRGVHFVQELLEGNRLGEMAVREDLALDGFLPDQIDTVLKKADVDFQAVMEKELSELLADGASRKALVTKLRDLGHDITAIRRSLRARRVDWAYQAHICAMKSTLYSINPKEISGHMFIEGFTPSQIEHALEHLDFGSEEMAAAAAQLYLKEWAISEEDLRDTLLEAGYRPKVIDAACKKNGLASVNWLDASVQPISEYLEGEDTISRSEAKSELMNMGYSSRQVTHAYQVLRPNWHERAYNCLIDLELDDGVLAQHAMRSALKQNGFRKEDIDYALKKHYGSMGEYLWAFRQACFLGIFFPSRRQIGTDLKAGGFSTEIVNTTLGMLWFDWRAHAFRTAQKLVEVAMEHGRVPFPHTILSFLSDEGFTQTDQKGIVEKLDVPWETIAAQVIEDELSSCCGLSWIENLLHQYKFSDAAIEKAKEIAQVDQINWKEQAQYSLARALDRQVIEPDQIRRMMHDRGLSDEEIAYAFSHTVIPKNIDWNGNALEVAEELEEELHLAPPELARHLSDVYLSKEQIDYVMENIKIDLRKETYARARDMIEMEVPGYLIPTLLEKSGFPAQQVHAAMRLIGIET